MGSTAIEKIFQRASLIGHVVEDLTFENVSPSRFRAELIGTGDAPQYKDEGFFVFSQLREGGYTLKITGERLQPATFEVEIPPIPPEQHVFLEPPGDSELIVIARKVEDDGENAGGKKIGFDPLILTRQIRAGARVLSDSLPAGADPAPTLAVTLEAGQISSARVMNAGGLAADSVVRFLRDKSIRMHLDPYYVFGSSITRVVGKVVSQQNTERPLAGARVRVTEVNDAPVTETDVHGLKVFKGSDVAGRAIVLGAEKDITAVSNERGDYNLYFSNETLASYQITDATMAALTGANVPPKVLEVLEESGALRDVVFRGRDRFAAALREEFSKRKVEHELLHKHQPLILEHAEGFIRKLTLEATLAGFDPVSQSALINTAQRKVVDFELAKSNP